MGELVAGRPIVQLRHHISPALDLISYMSLLYRAVPGSGLNAELIAARRALPDRAREDLDLLHGFSGRMLYYMEEPILTVAPLAQGESASCADILIGLSDLPPETYGEMALHALERVHQDLNTGAVRPHGSDAVAWRDYVLPALTTATPEDTLALLENPADLKARTIRLIHSICESGYSEAFDEHLSTLERARDIAERQASPGFGLAFSELTGNRLPATLAARMNEIERVTFCPSFYLGCFVSYILYSPDLIVYYGAPEYLKRMHAPVNGNGRHVESIPDASPLDEEELLDALKALSDSNRLRIVELLSAGELYAQEIVGRLGIAQSAVSRHLSLLERAGIIDVTPRRGMKYYSLNAKRMDEIAGSLLCRCDYP
jgi:DNA-binding transcriptional ArsR family regulator